MGLLTNLSLDDDSVNNDDQGTIVHVRLMAWCNIYEQHKERKRDKQRINTRGMAFNKMLEFLDFRR